VQAVVKSQSGPAGWALPYWDWQRNRSLPPAFRQPKLPASEGGGDNPLFRADRIPAVNQGSAFRPTVVASSAADATVPFFGGASLAFGFGGGVVDRPSHFNAGMTGLLELQPHNAIHRAVGGIMATAASPLDPIFWLHHAQIDRLWGRWLRLGQGRMNPTDPRWLGQPYSFYDAARTKQTQTPADVLSTQALGYRYDDDPPPSMIPLSARVPAQAEAALRGLEGITVVAPEPEELGASGPITLGAGAASATIDLARAPANDLAMLAVPDRSPSTVALVVDGIELEGEGPPAPTYEVYLGGDDTETGADHDSPHFVGFLEFFGLDHAHIHDEGDEHAHAGGHRRVFDITTLVHELQQRGLWDPARAKVSFVPARLYEDPISGEALPAHVEGDPHVRVGSVRIVVE
jgi:tyrosinase